MEARFRVRGKAPELWDAETGKIEAVTYRIEDGETVVDLTMAPEQSLHVVFRKPAQAAARTIEKRESVERGQIAGPWRVAFQANQGAPAKAVLPQLFPLNENSDPSVRYFSGIATYSNAFTTPAGWQKGRPLWLDLGEVREVVEVAINGRPAGAVWHGPYRIDVSAVAKPGRNTLQVRVANLWFNRLVGDAQPGAVRLLGE